MHHSIPAGVQRQTRQVLIIMPTGKSVILIDGSWQASGKAGLGILVFDPQEELVRAKGSAAVARGPLESEAMALCNAIDHAKGQRAGEFIVYTDCKALVSTINNNSTDEIPDWMATEAIANCVLEYHNLQGRITVQYVGRHLLKQPHNLANWARTDGNFVGIPSEQFMKELHLERRISRSLFILEGEHESYQKKTGVEEQEHRGLCENVFSGIS